MTKLFAELQGPLWSPGGLWKNSRRNDYRGSQRGSWVACLLTRQFLKRAGSRWRARPKDKPSGKISQWAQDWVRRSEIKRKLCCPADLAELMFGLAKINGCPSLTPAPGPLWRFMVSAVTAGCLAGIWSAFWKSLRSMFQVLCPDHGVPTKPTRRPNLVCKSKEPLLFLYKFANSASPWPKYECAWRAQSSVGVGFL